MNASLKNLAGLFKNTRTRTIIIFTGAILVFGVVVGLFRLAGHGGGPATVVTVKGAPSIESIPGGFEQPETAEYAQLQQQQNQQQAKTALQQGTSALPTLINASGFGQGVPAATQPCCNPCPCTNGAQAAGGLPLAQASSLKPGTLVYDAQGHVIGTVGPDGKVRDANGNVIGTVGPDGLIRDANGNVIGGAGAVAAGTPVYDANGKLIGTVGPDGKVRDANGNIIGTVGPDGVVRDLNGNIIGKAGVAAGTPLYDAQGKLIGNVGSDGKGHDVSACKEIGTVDSTGIVRDPSGKIIGKAGPVAGGNWAPAGTPVYDPQGQLVGIVDATGKVVNASCKTIGTAESTNGVVRDASGKIIGKAGTIVAGTPVYDANGHLIGTVGPDGKVRDANGNIIGTVGPDGVVRDLNGRVIGKVGSTMQGTPVYDAQGRLIGIVGPDGKVRDASGKVIGTMGLDGVIRDANGNVVGSTTAPGAAPSAAAPPGLANITGAQQAQPTALQQAMQRQEAMVSQQKADQLQQQMQSAMSTEANQLLSAAWVAPVQSFVAGNPPTTTPQQTAAQQAAAAAAAAAAAIPVVKAGTVMFAVLTTAVNSDEPGPILAKIVNGKFKGGTLLGTLTNQGQTVMLTFNTISLPDVSKSVSINAVAIDPDTARTSFSSDTNNHYILRYGSLFASSFIQGFGQAFTTSGQNVVSTGLATSTTTPSLSPYGKSMVALGNVGSQYSSRMGNVFNTPPTVRVNSGVAMGILFLSDIAPIPLQ